MATTSEVHQAILLVNSQLESARDRAREANRVFRVALRTQLWLQANTANQLGVPQIHAAIDSVADACALADAAIEENDNYGSRL
jgi:hypothetical protein